MKCFENRGLDKATQTFMENVCLSMLEFILEEGMDNALRHLSDVTEEDVRVFPHVWDALKERGILK